MPLTNPYITTNSPQVVSQILALDISTTSPSYVDMLVTTITTQGSTRLVILASFAVSSSGSSGQANAQIMVDGATLAECGFEKRTLAKSGGFALRTAVLAAGTHTVQLQWNRGSVSDTLYCRPVTLPAPEHCALTVMEVAT